MSFSRWPVYERVLANLVDGSAIQGVLLERRGPLLVLGDALLLTTDTKPTPMDGDVYIERDKVLFLQRVRGG